MKQDIINELEALGAHYIRSVRSPEVQARWVKDYLTDLGDIDLEALRKACAAWRQSEAQRFPTPGQLRTAALAHQPRQGQASARAWEPISDLAYDALSLRDKIRHQTILGNEAKMKAGPMWVNGSPAPAEQLPDRWHIWTRQAENHYAEAKRLRNFMQKQELSA